MITFEPESEITFCFVLKVIIIIVLDVLSAARLNRQAGLLCDNGIHARATVDGLLCWTGSSAT